MLKLKRLRVERFRSLVKGTELSFSDGINIVLGQNGTGKTTLLKLISMVVRSDFSSLAKEEFAIEYELSDTSNKGIIVVVQNERTTTARASKPLSTRESFHPSAQVLERDDRRQLLYFDAERGLSVEGAPPHGVVGVPAPVERGFLFWYIAQLPKQEFPLFRDIAKAGNAYRIDESLDLFRAITSNESPVGDILIGQQLMWQANLFAPPLISDEMLRKLEVWHQPTKPDYTFKNTDLTVIDTIKNIMGFHAADLRVDVAEKRDPATLQLGNFTFRFWWQDDTFITHEQLSYGQKRLLFFFYYLACNTDVVIADELVNGLHHRWIATSVEAIGPRQAFLTSQNPLLLDYIPITSTDEVRRSFVLCRSAPREGPPGWIWENMSEGDAQELYNAYEVGVEHVSEILQSRGLW